MQLYTEFSQLQVVIHISMLSQVQYYLIVILFVVYSYNVKLYNYLQILVFDGLRFNLNSFIQFCIVSILSHTYFNKYNVKRLYK